MKKIFITMASAALITSCAKQIDNSEIIPTAENQSILVGLVEPTRVAFTENEDESISMEWETDDIITIYNVVGSGEAGVADSRIGNFQYSKAGAGSEAVFTSMVSGETLTAGVKYNAVYPASDVATYTDWKALTASRAQTQDYSNGLNHFDSYSFMCDEFDFGAAWESGTPTPASKAVLKHQKAVITVTYQLDAGKIPTQVTFTDGSDEPYVITLVNAPAAEAGVDISTSFMIDPKAAEGVSRDLIFTVSDANGELLNVIKSSGKSYAAGKRYQAPITAEEFNGEIDSAADLIEFAELVNGGQYDLDATLTASFSMQGKTFSPIGASGSEYAGTFDGGNFTISDLTIDTPAKSYVGLFGRIKDATIKNVTLESPNFEGDAYVAGIAGGALNSTIENCHVKGSGTFTAKTYVGGIVGEAHATTGSSSKTIIKGCSNTGVKIIGNAGSSLAGGATVSRAGGIVGGINKGDKLIENCYNTAQVEGVDRVGGIVGYLYSTGKASNYSRMDIIACYNEGVIKGVSQVGGVVGFASITGTAANCTLDFIACYNNAVIDGTSKAGGVAGEVKQASASVFNFKGCYSGDKGFVAANTGATKYTSSYYVGSEDAGVSVAGVTRVEAMSATQVGAMNSAVEKFGYQYTGVTNPTLTIIL